MKKVKRFQEGGFNPRFSSNTYERARQFLQREGLGADTTGTGDAARAAKTREEPLEQIIQEAQARDAERQAAKRRQQARNMEDVIRKGRETQMADESAIRYGGVTAEELSEPPPRTPIVRPPNYERQIRSQAIEPVAPESYLSGAGALRGVAAGARALANRGVRQAEEGAAKAFTRPQAREVRESEAIKRAKEERRRASADARRNRDTDRMEGESLGPVKPRTNPKRESPPPRDMDEIRMSGEGPGFKRGGKAKFAQGGSVSSRADGIAQRGKTRGRMC